MSEEINTTLVCPKCKTSIDFKGLYDVIHNKVLKEFDLIITKLKGGNKTP